MALTGGISFIDLLKEKEDNVRAAIDKLDEAEKLIAYKYLRNSGVSMENIDTNIAQLIRKKMSDGG